MCQGKTYMWQYAEPYQPHSIPPIGTPTL